MATRIPAKNEFPFAMYSPDGKHKMTIGGTQPYIDLTGEGWTRERPDQLRNAVRNAIKENPMTETATSTAKKKSTSLRLTFTEDQAREYYTYLGGKMGEIQSDLAIRNGRVWDIAEKMAALKTQQDYIAEALRKHGAAE